jgi:hypothetical protein
MPLASLLVRIPFFLLFLASTGNRMEIPQGLATALWWIGILLIVFAVVDFGLAWVGVDITGVRWSPLVAGVLGSVLCRFFRGAVDDEE